MILHSETLIEASPADVFSFFDNMDKNYVAWHPDHHQFEWRKGRGCEVGNVFFFNETVAGQAQPKEVVFTEVKRDRLIAFAPTNRFFRLFLPRISFQMEPVGPHTNLVATLILRFGPLAQWIKRRELGLVRQHMHEEGENLKRMVEANQG